jgi:hypothetical protein
MRRMPRREAIKWVLAASASASLLGKSSFAAKPAAGYGTDPKLMEVYKPGDLWPLTLSAEQHRTVAALCDVILPADDKSPSASQLNVPDFIDEWISAPYPEQMQDRKQILEGIKWIERQSTKRCKRGFTDLTENEKRQICDEICHDPRAKGDLKKAVQFFSTFRNLTMSAFYTTQEGMKDIQYIGNVALTKFEGPPLEVLAYLKLDQG